MSEREVMKTPFTSSRRDFLRKTAAVSAGISIATTSYPFSARSYRRIIGSNERVQLAFMGLNGRGSALAGSFTKVKNCEIACLCDVDDNALNKGWNAVKGLISNTPKTSKDFRKVLLEKDIDAMVIATPDHWHAPAAILSCQAGKHVYVEKPICHNPREGELLVQAARKYNRIVQMGSQRRSWPVLTQGLTELKNGIIGRVYMASSWYVNNRSSIGIGKETPVPAGLDYDLWQGPAPRKAYKDNIIHYNWHWFWHWGTGEALNNGTHEIDVIRWGLGVDYPLKVNSAGGRYHYHDDWETPDTQIITYDVPGGISVVWEGRSCNGRNVDNRSRGVIFYGEKGAMHTGDNSYQIYDTNNKLLKSAESDIKMTDGQNTMSPGEALDILHLENFLDALRTGAKPNAEAETGRISTLWVQLGNIAHRTGTNLRIDQQNGHILDNPEAMKLWNRSYEPGWEPFI